MVRTSIGRWLLLFVLVVVPGAGLRLPGTAERLAPASTVRYVASDGADAPACTSAANPCRTLQHALDEADPGDEIRVAGGRYTPGGTVATISQPVRITGAYGPAFDAPDPDLYETVLDAGGGGSVVHIDNAGSVTLEHLTITGGDGSGNCGAGNGCGGGIYARETELFVRHCRIVGNVGNGTGDQMGWGGGVYARPGDREVAISHSAIMSNTGNTDPTTSYYTFGGGIFLRHGTAVLAGNHVAHNVASSAGVGGMGGGIFLYSVSHAQILDNRLVGNSGTAIVQTSGHGGALYSFSSTAYISGNEITGNAASVLTAGNGGGVVITGSSAHLDRNIITGNSTMTPGSGWYTQGGGIHINASSPVTLTNNLIAQNEASGGAITLTSLAGPGTQALLVNNTVADNGAVGIEVGQNTTVTLTNNLIAGHGVGISHAEPATGTVTANTNLFWNAEDPLVGTGAVQAHPLLGMTYRPTPRSPALDAGLTIPWLTHDLVGRSRPQGAGYDLGAFEMLFHSLYVPLVLTDDTPYTPASQALR
jgi:hypothetical protein